MSPHHNRQKCAAMPFLWGRCLLSLGVGKKPSKLGQTVKHTLPPPCGTRPLYRILSGTDMTGRLGGPSHLARTPRVPLFCLFSRVWKQRGFQTSRGDMGPLRLYGGAFTQLYSASIRREKQKKRFQFPVPVEFLCHPLIRGGKSTRKNPPKIKKFI